MSHCDPDLDSASLGSAHDGTVERQNPSRSTDMKRATLVLAVAALSVTGAAGAAQASTHHASNARHGHTRIQGTVESISRSSITVVNAGRSRTFARGTLSLNGVVVGAHVEAEGSVRDGVLRLASIHREDRVAGSAGATQPATTEPGDDRVAPIAGSTPVSSEPGDDRSGLTVPAQPAAREPGEDVPGHGGLDDGPNHR
jgi:hypothetical protein